MASIFEKLNLGDRQEIVVLRAPLSFEPELARLPVITIHHHLESVADAGFWLAFVTRKSEVEALAPKIAKRAKGDAVVWFAYPKGTSKNYTCDFNRDTGWDAMKALGFDTVRAVAIDEDWTALRFRRVELIKRETEPTVSEHPSDSEPSTLKMEKTNASNAKPTAPRADRSSSHSTRPGSDRGSQTRPARPRGRGKS